MAANTLAEFIDTYCTPKAAYVSATAIRMGASYPRIDVGDTDDRWPSVLVTAGDKAAVVRFKNVAADDPHEQHLCIDVHPFVHGRKARAGVFGLEVGRRLEGFPDSQADGTSHGFPAAHLVAVLVGRQADTPQGRVHWRKVHATAWLADDSVPLVYREAIAPDRPAGWYLNGAGSTFMSADEQTALYRAGVAIAAWNESVAGMTIDDLLVEDPSDDPNWRHPEAEARLQALSDEMDGSMAREAGSRGDR